jgi:hypothetical protein
MSGGGKSTCEKCGRNTSMSGSQMCRICDPDMEAIMNGEKPKSPHLCDRCFGLHMAAHNRTLEDFVRHAVNQHSGGVKFVELLAEVVAAKFEGGWTGEAIDTDSFPEILEQAIEKMPGVEILRYGWQMDDELKREKLFVYTP